MDTSPNKPALNVNRKRAAKACLCCRKRKVRCDVTRVGRPCTNCRLDDTSCLVIPRQPRFYERAGYSKLFPERIYQEPLIPEQNSAEMQSPPADEDTTDSTMSSEHDEAETLPDASEASKQILGEVDSMLHHLGMTPGELCLSQEPELYQLLSSEFDTEVVQSLLQDDPTPPLGSGAVSNPWINLEAPSTWHTDISYLRSRGCFRVPCDHIVAEFVKCFFSHVHPMLPLLREDDFWNHGSLGVDRKHVEGGEGTCLMLLQSILFASCRYLPLEMIRNLGFDNTKAAEAYFYGVSKLLYDHSNETDHVSMAKSALLLTYWDPLPHRELRRSNSKWLAIAIHHATAAGANRYDANDVNLKAEFSSTKERNKLKRLWWCCIIRDRILSLSLRRSPMITRLTFNFISNEPLEYSDLRSEIKFSRVYQPEIKRYLIKVLSLLIELCVCLTDTLELVYPAQDTPLLDMEPMRDRGRACRHQLTVWHNKATQVLAMGQTPQGTLESFECDHISTLYTHILYMHYSAARIALYNHELRFHIASSITSVGSKPHESAIGTKPNDKELRDGITSIIQRLNHLLELKVVRWLPSSVVACMTLPLALKILELKKSLFCFPTFKEANFGTRVMMIKRQLIILVSSLKECHAVHNGVDWTSKVVRYFFECTYLDERPFHNEESGDNDDQSTGDPSYYLRMVLTIDLSLRQDKLPEEHDFPKDLRRLMTRTGCFMPISFGQSDFASEYSDDDSIGIQSLLGYLEPTYDQGWIDNDRSLHFAREIGLLSVD